MKARAVVGQFEIVLHNWEGRVIKYQMKLRNGYLVVKEAEGCSSKSKRGG